MNWRMLVERRAPAKIGILCVFVLVLATLEGCGGSEKLNEAPDLPATLAEVEKLVVRVSGMEGVEYEGDYRLSPEGDADTVEAETLGDEPTDYELEIEETSSTVLATFRKTQPGTGGLKVEILADDQTIAQSSTHSEFGTIIAEWSPRSSGPPGEVIPGEVTPGEEE